jgi:hypothetical protein
MIFTEIDITSIASGMFLAGFLCGILFANGLIKFIEREIRGNS